MALFASSSSDDSDDLYVVEEFGEPGEMERLLANLGLPDKPLNRLTYIVGGVLVAVAGLVAFESSRSATPADSNSGEVAPLDIGATDSEHDTYVQHSSIVTPLPMLPFTHWITPSSSTSARFVLRLYVF